MMNTERRGIIKQRWIVWKYFKQGFSLGYQTKTPISHAYPECRYPTPESIGSPNNGTVSMIKIWSK